MPDNQTVPATDPAATAPLAPVPELLAPAGDFEALRAAVANGADAVYFGLDDFNARHRAENFTLEKLPETMAYLRTHGVRGYVAFNTLIFADELERAAQYLAAIIRAGTDAVIVQDLGIVRLVKALSPEFAVHGSTQMTLTEPRGIDFVGRLGVERVIVARELSLVEIERIANRTAMPLEVFVHGALCVAYSGQCLTSEALGGRSANRGQCAQACRQPYELIVDGAPRDLRDKAYLLSPQDLSAWDLTPELTRAGVCSLKIEGRLKSAHYVAATTQTYRGALDAAARGEPFDLDHQQRLDLAQSFSRGFTHGFLDGVNHRELVQGRFPKHRGVKVGTVVRTLSTEVIVRLDPEHIAAPIVPLKPGDGVVFDEGHPEQDEQGGRLFVVEETTLDGERCVALEFGRGDVNLRAIAPGAMVWRTDDPALRRRLERSFAKHVVPRRVPLRLVVCGRPGAPLTINVSDDAGCQVQVATEGPLEAARKHPVTVPLIEQQFGRLGGTPFLLAGIQLWLAAETGTAAGAPTGERVEAIPVMIPKSVLNDLRRQAVTLLEAKRAARARGLPVDESALGRLRSSILARPATGRVAAEAGETRVTGESGGLQSGNGESGDFHVTFDSPRLSVLCRTPEQASAVLNWNAPPGAAEIDWLLLDFEEVRRSAEAVAKCRVAGRRVALATPRVIKPSEEGLLKQIARCQPDGVLVRNLAALDYFRAEHAGLRLLGDYALNVANDLTADLFLTSGLERLVPSYDLNLEQLLALLERIDPGRFEVVVHQHVPMFHMEHCVFSHVLSNGKDFHDCGRPCDRHRIELRDHVGEAHPLAADVGCRNTIFNARAQSAAPYVSRLLKSGIRQFRVELLRESAEDAHSLLTQYALVVTGRSAGPKMWHDLQVINQVGITRGTLEFA